MDHMIPTRVYEAFLFGSMGSPFHVPFLFSADDSLVKQLWSVCSDELQHCHSNARNNSVEVGSVLSFNANYQYLFVVVIADTSISFHSPHLQVTNDPSLGLLRSVGVEGTSDHYTRTVFVSSNSTDRYGDV